MLIKLIFYIIIIAVMAVGAVWFSASPGQMVAEWNGYEITTTTANFIFVVILMVAVIGIIIPTLLGLLATPHRWWKKKQDAKYKRSLACVTETLTAIASGDVVQAELLLKRSKKILHNQPIMPLLQAQLAGVKKDQTALQNSFQAMLEHPETKALGSKSLAEYHMRKGDVIPAISHAEQALELEPKNSESIRTTMLLYFKSGQYERAKLLLQQSRKRKSFSRAQEKELLACILYLQTEQAELTKDEHAAKRLISEAYKLSPERAHIYAKYIDLHNNDKDISKAVQVLSQSWKNHYTDLLPHLADDLLLDRTAKRRLLKRQLGKSPAGKLEALRLLAGIAVKDQDEFEAHAWLGKYLQLNPGSFTLPPKPNVHKHISHMAEIQEILAVLEKHYMQKKWECMYCDAMTDAWHPTCTNCNALNSIVKK